MPSAESTGLKQARQPACADAPFNIHHSDALTRNVAPLLHEIKHALARLIDTGETSIIDLRSIPLAPGEENKILQTLGRGEVSITLDALGPSEIIETQFAGVWLITHFNEENSIISRFIEVCTIPDILHAQAVDIKQAQQQLAELLAAEAEQ